MMLGAFVCRNGVLDRRRPPSKLSVCAHSAYELEAVASGLAATHEANDPHPLVQLVANERRERREREMDVGEPGSEPRDGLRF
jgi:hypothetical protein